MDGKVKRLNALLITFIIIGILLTCYVTFFMSILATDSGGGLIAALGGGLFGFTITFSIFVLLPYLARKSLKKGKVNFCIAHVVISFLTIPLLWPFLIWEIILIFKVKNYLESKNA